MCSLVETNDLGGHVLCRYEVGERFVYLSDVGVALPGSRHLRELKIRHVLSVVEFESLDNGRKEPFWASLVRLYETSEAERGWIQWEESSSWVKVVVDLPSGILYCNLSVPDLSDPKLLEKLIPPVDPVELLCLATLYIQKCVEFGNVLVHCTKGQRRSPTIFLAWLVTQGYSLAQGMKYLEERYEGEKDWGVGYRKSRSFWLEFLEKVWYPNWREHQRKWCERYSAGFEKIFEKFHPSAVGLCRNSGSREEEDGAERRRTDCSLVSGGNSKRRVHVVTQKMVPKLWNKRLKR
ncbi:uncharacterized protein LOC126317005 [Schistocerca gregaria]|uniref:uncharacterized protein LOC126317005 n=1 Tax=Schistocerca gregaria TaxID=7010 RepID=UPI00211F435A|nr:uncharacterized protein LOC126317005 [Schistocerca gregaria]